MLWISTMNAELVDWMHHIYYTDPFYYTGSKPLISSSGYLITLFDKLQYEEQEVSSVIIGLQFISIVLTKIQVRSRLYIDILVWKKIFQVFNFSTRKLHL